MRVAPLMTAVATATSTWNGFGCDAFAYFPPRRRSHGLVTSKPYSTAISTGSAIIQPQRDRRRPYRRLQKRPSRTPLSSDPSFVCFSSSSSSALFATESAGRSKSKKAAKRKRKQLKNQSPPNKDNGNDDQELTEEETVFVTTESSITTSPFATTYHAPVMWKECIEGLLCCARAQKRRQNEEQNDRLIFVDGTLGGGGHSEALLQQLQARDVVLGCDVDPKALATASQRLEKYMDNDPALPTFVPVASNFAHLAQVLLTIPNQENPLEANEDDKNDHEQEQANNMLLPGVNSIDGILLDLGVSSHQIDTPERGFAFMKDGPLDMRMGAPIDQQDSSSSSSSSSSSLGMTAADLCNELDEDELARILKQYGDEQRSRVIARSIIEHRPLSTTQDLMQAVSAVTPAFHKSKRKGRTATLARVFQSLRIVVNQEDQVLRQVLEETCPALLREGGRLVVLSYHSMEDRATKRVMRDGTTGKYRITEKDIFGNYAGPQMPFKPVGKFQKASEEEVSMNPRARSATLRIAERLVIVDDEEDKDDHKSLQ